MPKNRRVPSYRYHKASDQAVVVLEGKSHYLGPWNSPESRVEYDRLIAEWWLKSKRVEMLLATGKNPPIKSDSAIAVPAQIYDWKAAPETRTKAQQVQERNREQFLSAFSQGLAALGRCQDQGR